MAELDSDILESADEAQAVKARFNPWWIVGAFIFVVAVVLGFRSLSKPKLEPEEPVIEIPA